MIRFLVFQLNQREDRIVKPNIHANYREDDGLILVCLQGRRNGQLVVPVSIHDIDKLLLFYRGYKTGTAGKVLEWGNVTSLVLHRVAYRSKSHGPSDLQQHTVQGLCDGNRSCQILHSVLFSSRSFQCRTPQQKSCQSPNQLRPGRDLHLCRKYQQHSADKHSIVRRFFCIYLTGKTKWLHRPNDAKHWSSTY